MSKKLINSISRVIVKASFTTRPVVMSFTKCFLEQPLKTTLKPGFRSLTMSFIRSLRLEFFVASAPILASLSIGGSVSYPTVLLHQLKKNDTTIPLDFDTASWIGAIHGISGIPSILMPALMQWKGRKIAFIIGSIFSIIGWILAYTATSASAILASESFHGLGSNCIYSVTCLSITELMAPEYRDPFMQMYLIVQVMAMALNGLLTHYLHWKTIGLIMCFPMLPALVIGCLWPESPYWLACKGEFSRCEKAFTWLRGTDEKSNKELRELISAQKETIAANKTEKQNTFKHYFDVIRTREFYVPAAQMLVLHFVVHGIGSIIILIYSIEMFYKTTGREDVAFYGGFVINGIQLLGITVAMLILNRFFEKKTVLLSSLSAAIISLISASISSFLQTEGILPQDSLICLFCLIAFVASVSFGVIAVAYPTASSLIPVRFRGIGGILFVVSTCTMFTVALKIFPYLILYIGLSGTFLLFALNGAVCGIIIWRYVPETKGRTLQEIEDYYTYGSFVRDRTGKVYTGLVPEGVVK